MWGNSLFLFISITLRLYAKTYLYSFLFRQSLPVFLQHRSIAGLMRKALLDQ